MNNFKPLGTYIIVHSRGEEKQSFIAIPKTGSYAERKQWTDRENTVFAIGDEVKKVKVGDRVFLDPLAKMRKPDQLTKIIEEKLGIKTTVDVLNKDGKKVGEEEVSKYFTVKEDEIMCIVE